jgi:hypothetical protein
MNVTQPTAVNRLENFSFSILTQVTLQGFVALLIFLKIRFTDTKITFQGNTAWTFILHLPLW